MIIPRCSTFWGRASHRCRMLVSCRQRVLTCSVRCDSVRSASTTTWSNSNVSSTCKHWILYRITTNDIFIFYRNTFFIISLISILLNFINRQNRMTLRWYLTIAPFRYNIFYVNGRKMMLLLNWQKSRAIIRLKSITLVTLGFNIFARRGCTRYGLFDIFSASRNAQLRHYVTADVEVDLQAPWKQIKRRSKKYAADGTYDEITRCYARQMINVRKGKPK